MSGQTAGVSSHTKISKKVCINICSQTLSFRVVWPPHLPNLNLLFFHPWGQLETLLHSAPTETEQTLHQHIFNANNTICNHAETFERGQWSKIRRVHLCTDSRGGHFEHLLQTVT
jgi:hypothetical protein